MKKIVLALAAVFAMSASAVAQDEVKKGNGERKQFDKTEMIKQRTAKTVKELGLDEAQAAKLLELNTKYADQLAPRRGPRGMRPGAGKPESRLLRKPAPDSLKQRPEGRPGQEPPTEEMKQEREQMQKTMEAYDAELKTILTEEQFAAFKENQKKQMQRGPRDGKRPQRNGKKPREEGQDAAQ